jgi:hypothetical protein
VALNLFVGRRWYFSHVTSRSKKIRQGERKEKKLMMRKIGERKEEKDRRRKRVV